MKSDPKVLVLFLPVVMDVATLADSTTLNNGGVLVGRAGAWVVGLSRRKKAQVVDYRGRFWKPRTEKTLQ